MNIVFCGSGAFGAPTLKALATSGHNVIHVFTNPDRPAGRGSHVNATPIKTAAEAMEIPVYQPETLKDGTAAKKLQELAPDLAVVVAYGHLIPQDMLEIPAHGFINLHASILPRYRGAAPVPHAILHGEKETGVTVFRLNCRFDEGDILAIEKTPIGPEDTSSTVLERLAPVGARLVTTVIGEFSAGWTQPVPQDDLEATLAPKLTKEMGRIDWSLTCAQVGQMVRAFQPWPLAYTFLHGFGDPVRIVVLEVEKAAPPHSPVKPGTILHADPKDGLIVMAGDGALWLRRLKPAGKREMTAPEYLRGARIEPDMRME